MRCEVANCSNYENGYCVSDSYVSIDSNGQCDLMSTIGGASNGLNPCPFCGSKDIKFSVKTAQSNFERIYHASLYCNSCHCYGSRVLRHVNENESRSDIENDAQLFKQAADAWNRRA